MPMNLRQMEVFRAVMREGSITAAANSLNVSQPSVSEVLRHAESRCGFQLFERDRGRLRPTASALRLREEVETVFQNVARVNRIVEELKSEREMTLMLGCVYSLTLALGPKIISRLHLREPRLTARVVVDRRAEVGSKVNSGLIDAALSFLTDPYPGTEVLPLRQGTPRFLCPRDHPLAQESSVSIGQLEKETFIGYLPHLSLQQLISTAFEARQIPFKSVLEVEQVVQAWALVQAGRGVAIIDPFCNLDNFFPDVTSIEILDLPQFPLELIVKKGKPHSRTLTCLIDVISEVV